MFAFHIAVGGFDMIDADVERLPYGVDRVIARRLWQMLARRVPPVLKTHAPERQNGDALVGLSKPAVFHLVFPEKYAELDKGFMV